MSASHGVTSSGGAVAPMPGVIEKVTASVGQAVEEGDPLLVMIAMKMEASGTTNVHPLAIHPLSIHESVHL